jgi:hypothetical protein
MRRGELFYCLGASKTKDDTVSKIISAKPTTTTKPIKRPAAQIEPAKKAAKAKDDNAAKRPQPSWLQRPIPALKNDEPPTPERLSAAHQSQGPPRLLDRHEVCAIINVSYPTLWGWMRAAHSRAAASSAERACGSSPRSKPG